MEAIVLKIKSKICSMTFMWNLKEYRHLNLYVYGFVGFFFFFTSVSYFTIKSYCFIRAAIGTDS